ncbi:hypothetical protein [Phormidium nigroviride]
MASQTPNLLQNIKTFFKRTIKIFLKIIWCIFWCILWLIDKIIGLPILIWSWLKPLRIWFQSALNIALQDLKKLTNLKQVYKWTWPIFNYLWQNPLFSFVLLGLLVFTLITLSALLPATHNFEGNLIAKEISFTYDDNRESFIENIDGIQKISVFGNTPDNKDIVFEGKNFKSSCKALENLNNPKTPNDPIIIRVALTDDNSQWIITPIEDVKKRGVSQSQIKIEKLKLEKGTLIKNLTYENLTTKQIKFNLNSTSSDANILDLDLDVGKEPIKIELSNYKFSGDNQPNCENDNLTFTFEPDTTKINTFLLITRANIAANISKISANISIELKTPPEDSSSSWFLQNLIVKNVNFTKESRRDSSESVNESTIISGIVRMAGQDITLETGQFLIVKPDDIKRLRRIDFSKTNQPEKAETTQPENPEEGLKVLISGKTDRIEVGLDKKLPTSSIQGTWLNRYIPRDIIIGLFAICGAVISYLLYWLLEYPSKHKSP